MTKGTKALVAVVLVFSLLLSGVGYASLTDTLAVTGSASAEAPEEVYIYETGTASGITNLSYTETVITADVDFSASNTIEISASVFNNTVEEYMYYGVLYTPVLGNSEKFNYQVKVYYADGTDYVIGRDGNQSTGDGAITGEKIAAGEKHNDLLVTITNTSEDDIKTGTVSFSLFYKQSSFHNGWVPLAGAAEKFEEILNTLTDYNDLINYLVNGSQRVDDSYIGNVSGAPDEEGSDDYNIEQLFGDVLKKDLDGDPTTPKNEITVMIKAHNLDGDVSTGKTVGDIAGAEITLFMTPAVLGDTNYVTNGSYVVTYAVNFRYVAASDSWEQVGDEMKGVCQTNNYENGNSGNNSINTSTWCSIEEYTVNGNVVSPAYSVSSDIDYSSSVDGDQRTTGADITVTYRINLGFWQTGAQYTNLPYLYKGALADHLAAQAATVEAALIPNKKEYL